MRKFILGLLCGAVLFTGANVATGAVKNALVGKRVADVMTVGVDGKSVGSDAVIIEGKSYLPVRDFVNSVGGNIVSVENRHIEIATIKGDVVEEFDEEKAVNEIRLKGRIAETKSLIEYTKSKIESAKRRKALAQEQIDNGEDLILATGGTIPFKESDVYERFMAEIAEENETIEALEAEIARLESEIAALEAELAELTAE